MDLALLMNRFVFNRTCAAASLLNNEVVTEQMDGRKIFFISTLEPFRRKSFHSPIHKVERFCNNVQIRMQTWRFCAFFLAFFDKLLAYKEQNECERVHESTKTLQFQKRHVKSERSEVVSFQLRLLSAILFILPLEIN